MENKDVIGPQGRSMPSYLNFPPFSRSVMFFYTYTSQVTSAMTRSLGTTTMGMKRQAVRYPIPTNHKGCQSLPHENFGYESGSLKSVYATVTEVRHDFHVPNETVIDLLVDQSYVSVRSWI